jgi:hypothetical protein
LLVGLVLVFSGAYLLIYLYRWEWNRAIISGLFFVAAEVALATSMLTRRLRAIEPRREGGPAPRQQVLARLRSTPVDRPRPFDWLTESSRQGPGVFVPVLLGAGVVLSALAYVVERIAEATALPMFDRRLARRLAAVAPPEGGLLGSRAPSPRPVGRQERGRVLGPVIGVAAIVAVLWMGVQMLGDVTQSRPDPTGRPVRTIAELDVSQRGSEQPAVQAAEALWVGCRSTLGSLDADAEVVALGGDHVAIVLEPGIGRLGTRRLTGCLSDVRVDLVRADVVSVRHEQ